MNFLDCLLHHAFEFLKIMFDACLRYAYACRLTVSRPRELVNVRAQFLAFQRVGVDRSPRRRSLITLLQLLHNGDIFQNGECVLFCNHELRTCVKFILCLSTQETK